MGNQETRRPTVSVGTKETEEKNVEVAELTEEESRAQLLAHEEDFLQGLIDAENYMEDEQVLIEIARKDKKTGKVRVFYQFHIKPLSEDEYIKCRKKWTKYKKNKQFGFVTAEETDAVKFRDELIYKATIPEDRAKLWDNKKAWAAYEAKGHQIMSGLDIIEYSLKAGEKDRIIDMIDRISGYEEDNLEDVVKN